MRDSMGPRRTPLIHRHQGLLDAGVMVAGSSDRPVATGRPLSIIQSMVDRLAADGSLVGPAERVSVQDALWTYTVGSAQTTGMADRKGMLRPGFLGDVVVLSGNPLQNTGQSLAELDVLHTVMDGQVTVRDGALTS
jgi:predicted amidohydrolase YtcJ